MSALRIPRPRSKSPAARSLPQRLVFALLIALLVSAQTLGLLHRTVHGGAGGARSAEASPASPTAPLLSKLFAHGDGSTACQLYDQLSHGDSLPSLAALLLAAPPPVAPDAPTAEAPFAPFTAAFLARAPPVLV